MLPHQVNVILDTVGSATNHQSTNPPIFFVFSREIELRLAAAVGLGTERRWLIEVGC